MEYPRLIHDYLDGELHHQLEDKLFAEMAINQDVRSEFSRQLQLHSYTNQDMNSIDIPSETTAAVFSSLGFSIPTASSPNVGFGYYWAWLQQKGFRRASLILLFLMSIVGAWQYLDTPIPSNNLASTGTYPLTSSFANDNQNMIEEIGKKSPAIIKSTKSNNYKSNKQIFKSSVAKDVQSSKTSATSSTILSGNSSIYAELDKNTDKALVSENSSKNSEASIQGNAFKLISYSNIYPASGANADIIHRNDFSSISIMPKVFKPELTILSSEENKIELNWKKTDSYYGKRLNLPSNDNTFFQGNSISLLYRINREHALGLEFGEEAFYQEFNFHNGDQIATYRQMPNYLWGGISYRYSPDFATIAEILQPFSSITIGGAKGGAIGKMQIGVSLRISPSISAFALGELGSMVYNIRETVYYSNNFKFMYGIGLSL